MNTATTESIRLPEIIASMLNYAGVADTCEVTQGHAPVAIRNWAEMLQQLAAPAAVPVDVLREAAALADAVEKNGQWDDGCFYYNKHAASELQTPLTNLRRALATHPQPAAANGVPELFVQWLEREMPAGTIIGKPAWWAPKLARALRSAERGVLGGCNG